MSTDIQRNLTELFIGCDPKTIILIPRVETTTPGGGKSYADGTPRKPQTFKLSLLGNDQRPIATVSGQERRIEYHLIGPHDAEIAVGDYWVEDDGTRFEVMGFTDGYGYERKALVYRHSPRESVF
jgi:hypothetical protein